MWRIDREHGEQTVIKATARIDWRKLAVPSLLIMVLPTVAAVCVDRWLGTLPLVTLAAILICFPLATFFVIRIALQEMDRVIAEVAPPLEWEAQPDDGRAEPDMQDEVGLLVEDEAGERESSQSEVCQNGPSQHAE